MDETSPTDFRHLPEPVRLEDTIAQVASTPPPDPQMGRDTETEFVLRHAV